MTIKLEPGQSEIGIESCTIESITSNAVVVLKRPDSDVYAAINIDVADAPKAEQIIEDLLKQYTAGFRSTSANELEATIIGGKYRENRHVPEEYFVYRDHVLAHKKVEEALAAYEVHTTYFETDILATKKVLVEKGRIMLVSQKREGNNAFDAIMSENEYESTTSLDRICE